MKKKIALLYMGVIVLFILLAICVLLIGVMGWWGLVIIIAVALWTLALLEVVK